MTKKDIVRATASTTGDMPYEITDLSRVWVLADVYETELSRIQLGMSATLPCRPSPTTFTGKVDASSTPSSIAKTRTAKVRLEFANPKGELKPGMFGEVDAPDGESAKACAIPPTR